MLFVRVNTSVLEASASGTLGDFQASTLCWLRCDVFDDIISAPKCKLWIEDPSTCEDGYGSVSLGFDSDSKRGNGFIFDTEQ